MTLLFVALSIVPIVQVESRLVFAAKLSALIVGANALGLAIFLETPRSLSRPGRARWPCPVSHYRAGDAFGNMAAPATVHVTLGGSD